MASLPTGRRPSVGASPGPLGRGRERAARRLHAWPLTWRLITIVVVLLAVALALTTAATQLVLRGYLVERTDAELSSAALVAATNTAAVTHGEGHVLAPVVPSSYVMVLMDTDGDLVRRPIGTRTDDDSRPSIPALPLADPRVASRTPFTVAVSPSQQDSWRVVAGPLTDGSGTYAVALPLRGVEETLAQLRAFSLALGAGVVILGATLGWLGIRRAFRPLRVIEDTAAAIADGDLTRRVPEHAAQDEVASLSRSLNAMLAQVEASFAVREASEERMRRFVTDASHELRTPLATVRGYAELYRQGAASSPEQTSTAMRRIEDEATRMSGLVEDLLTLARLDANRPLVIDEVDLTVLASDAVADARVRDPRRTIRLTGLDGHALGPALVRGDDARLRQVVTNLVANALQHTPAGVPLEVAVGDALGDPAAGLAGRAVVRLEVTDHGPGIPEADVDRVFQRFYRGDPSRGRSSGGSGLGLAIVMAIVAAHRGRVGHRHTPGGGATFVVELPRDGGAPPADPPAPEAPTREGQP